MFECLKCIPFFLLLTQLFLGNSFFDTVESFTFWRHFLIEGKDLWKTVMSIQQTLGHSGSDNEVIGGSCLGKLPQVGMIDWPPRWMAWRMADVLFTLWLPWFFKNLFVCFLKWSLSNTWWVGKIFTSYSGYWMHSTLLVVNIVTSHSTPSRHFTGGSCVACTFGGRYFEDFHLDGNGRGVWVWTNPRDFSATFFSKTPVRSVWEYSLHTMWCGVHLGQPLLKSHLGAAI